MVTPKAGNKRRGGSGISGGNKMSNKRFKPNMASVAGAANLFQTSQIPDNPGYLDFNDPLQTPSNSNNRSNTKGNKQRHFKRNQGGMGNGVGHKLRQNSGGPANSRGGNWGNKGNLSRNNRASSNRGNQIPPVQMGPPSRMGPRMGAGRIRPPPPPPIAMMGGPMPPIPPPNFMPSRMGPGPMGPPPMMGPPLPPLGPPRGPPRAMPGRRMGLRNSVINDTPSNIGGSMRRGKHVTGGNKGKGRKTNSNNRGNQTQTPVKNRSSKRNRTGSSKKTLKEIINQYSLDKPWVTDEIKAEAKIKEEIESKLKGKKDDKLFAEFKVQRDKFVAMYEAAKKEHMDKKKKQQKVSNNETNTNESDKGEKNANTAAST
ncbi:DNA-binding protein K10-like [Condylostylus longicornis]|uniref:DNA-binding protein K10-like n=1 Tax=Condylostylus longicornis TaxID=2530218 RepID=UPI00244E2BF3|nr:DNA-binding protein K10-like [Condylostylus longicornis]